MLRNMARLHRCKNYCSFICIWGDNTKKMYHYIIFFFFFLRSHLKNSCFMFRQGFQTPWNNKSTGPAASCFHLFLGGVWNPWWSPHTRFDILLEHLANQLVLMETTIFTTTVVIFACINSIYSLHCHNNMVLLSRHSANTGPFFSIVWYSLPIISVLYWTKCRHFRLGIQMFRSSS